MQVNQNFRLKYKFLSGSLSLPLENEDGEQLQKDTQSLAQQPAVEQNQQQSKISGAQDVPLLNIETPEQNNVPEFSKNQMNEVSEEKLSSEFASSQQPSTSMMTEPSSPSRPSVVSQLQTNEPPSSDIPAGSTDIQNAKNDIMNLQQKSKGSLKASSMNNDEESEALKEENEANKLITNKEPEITQKIQDRPDIIGLGRNGMPSSLDKNTINLQTGNIASSPESGMNINQQQSFTMDHFQNMDKIHEGEYFCNLVSVTSIHFVLTSQKALCTVI